MTNLADSNTKELTQPVLCLWKDDNFLDILQTYKDAYKKVVIINSNSELVH